jgi:hypothetical protein
VRPSGPLLASALALSVLLGACRTSTPAEDAARELLIASVEATQSEDSSRMTLSVVETVGGQTGQQRGGGEDVERFAAVGVVDFEGEAASFTFDISRAGVPGGTGEVEIRQIGEVFYVQVPGGAQWLEIDGSTVAEQLGDPTGMRSALGTSPTALLDLLRGTSAARSVGRDDVRGEETRHFTAAVDVQEAARETDGARRAALERLASQLEGTTLPLEVWIDDDDRVVKMRIPVVTTATAAEPDPPRITTAVEFFDFGTTVDVSPPPEDEIVRP